MKRVIISITYDDAGESKTDEEAIELAEGWLASFMDKPWCGITEIFEFKVVEVKK